MKTKYLTPELTLERLYETDVMAASDETSSNESSSIPSDAIVENSILNAWWS